MSVIDENGPLADDAEEAERGEVPEEQPTGPRLIIPGQEPIQAGSPVPISPLEAILITNKNVAMLNEQVQAMKQVVVALIADMKAMAEHSNTRWTEYDGAVERMNANLDKIDAKFGELETWLTGHDEEIGKIAETVGVVFPEVPDEEEPSGD